MESPSEAPDATPSRFGRIVVAFGRGLLWPFTNRKARRFVAIGVVVALLIVFVCCGVQRVEEGKVGVLVDNCTGELRVEDAVGYRFVVPVLQSLYTLDRKVRTLTMADAPSAGSKGGDAIRIKTLDGSDVSLDLQVSYQLDAKGAAEVLRNAGRDESFADLWVRPAVRAAAASEFGELTTEQIYDAAKRDEKAHAVVKSLNDELARRHLQVLAVVPNEMRFFSEYEDLIKKKKVADQDTVTQKSELELALKQQTKELNQAKAEKEQRVAKAKSEAENVRRLATGYAARVRNEADAELVTAEGEAKKVENEGLADAHGLKEKADALAGTGGVGVVLLSYAKKLATIAITGLPVRQDGVQNAVRVQTVPALTAPQAQPTVNDADSSGPPIGPARPPSPSPRFPPNVRPTGGQ
jgi:regulator of protease activity HflC (stomatin/prohibitin superfamily)